MKTFFTLFALAFSLVGRAQINLDTDSLTVPPIVGYNRGTYVVIGPPIIAGSVVNYMPGLTRLANRSGGPSTVLNRSTFYKLGFFVRRFRAEVGINYSIPMEFSTRRNSASIGHSFTYGGVAVGYTFAQNRNRIWNVYVGVGSLTNTAIVAKASNTPVDFDQALTAPTVGQSPVFVHRSTCLELSIENTFRKKKPVGFGSSFAIGVRRGTRKKTWEAEFVNLQNAPNEQVVQVFLHSAFVITQSSKRK